MLRNSAQIAAAIIQSVVTYMVTVSRITAIQFENFASHPHSLALPGDARVIRWA